MRCSAWPWVTPSGLQSNSSRRGTFTPVTDMVGGGPFRLPAGAWTDDTSLALCLATSLHECGGFDADDRCSATCAGGRRAI
ncbi:MAG: ADP-ribosylglycohydrolase family protein [Caldilineaceae bacterium]